VYTQDFELDDEEDEDIDQLIEDLESQDGENADYEEEEVQQPGGARLIPEDLLQTDTRIGLTSAEVLIRRKKFGENKMKGMWCSYSLLRVLLTLFRGDNEQLGQVSAVLRRSHPVRYGSCRYPRCWPPRLGRLRRHLRFASIKRMRRIYSGVPGWLHRRRTEEVAGSQGYCSA
jgi:hypothetical protein